MEMRRIDAIVEGLMAGRSDAAAFSPADVNCPLPARQALETKG